MGPSKQFEGIKKKKNADLTTSFMTIHKYHINLGNHTLMTKPQGERWSPFQMKLIVSILLSEFKVGVFNGVNNLNFFERRTIIDFIYTVRCTNFKSWPWNEYYQFHFKLRRYYFPCPLLGFWRKKTPIVFWIYI